MRSIKHQIFYFPESKVHLESICELRCDTSIDSSYFYGLSQICQYIQRFIIYNTKPQPNNGIAKLIEVQKNLKHFEWINEFHDDYLKDPYVEIFLALEKKANSLNYLRVFIDYVNNIAHTLFQEILPKFYKLKILKIDAYPFFTEEQLKKLKMQVYYDLEILNIEYNELNVISSVIENSGGHLKKILFSPYKTYDYGYPPNLKENSLNFIRKVYEYCPSIEYLSILFSPSEEHFTELEKLLKICQNIKSLLIVMKRIVGDKEYGKKLLEILIRSAPMNLKEIRIGKEFKFSLENLKKFLDRWRSRPALSLFILTSDPIYIGEDFTRLIDKYKSDGVIKDFKYGSHTNDIDYVFNI
ncbi:20571_t:CDS:1 [Rhizophagus irregularis]|nr:20571_t:CDS:1 [Rhizophagus irregularis]